MTQRILFWAAMLFAAPLFAQAPVNDDCSKPIELGTAPTCSSDIYSTIDATPSDIGSNNIPSCLTEAPARDVWFTFVCPSNIIDFRVELTGTGASQIQNPVVTVYRGDCSVDGLAELSCSATTLGATAQYFDLEALTPGATYFIRVSDNSPAGDPHPGTFNLCVNEIPPIVTIDQGSSSLCSGTLYDTGGPNGDYGINEDFTFTICPTQAPACITFTLDYFSLDVGNVIGDVGNDVLSFFDGSDVNAPALAKINGFSGAVSDPASTIGGGGVCFQVQATSGCLTLSFQSDAFVNFEGFAGHWECSQEPCELKSALEVETSVVPQDIVNSILAPGTTVTVTDIKCAPGAYGTFSFAGDDNDLGLKKGLLLTSGKANAAIGPNGPTISNINGTAGDNNLDSLSLMLGGFSKSFDACVVELDVFVASDELTFEYVFGSEEYPEYVNDIFNDIFAFLASGPGITGLPGLGNAKNIAIIPGGTTPVQINSVNNLTNWEYYRNNGVELNSTLAYDGFTSDFMGSKKSLTARVDVIPCNTYHLKLAVSDRGDPALDSGVFISEVKGGAPKLSVEFASGIDYFIENCSGNLDQLIIRLDHPKAVAVTYTISLGGTATPGLDYLLNIPPVITFQPGDSVLIFPIQPLGDLLTEGTETITISISKYFGCGTVVFQTLNIDLKDNPEVLINAGADTLYVCPGGTTQLEAVGALNYFWEPPLAVSDPFVPNPTITPDHDILLKVTGSIGDCTDTDSVFVRILSAPTLEIQSVGNARICQGDTLQLLALSNAGTADIKWTPKTRLSDPASFTPLVYPLATATYTASLSVAGCAPVNASIEIKVDTLFFPDLAKDTTLCQNFPVRLAAPLAANSSVYAWSPETGLNDPSSASPSATPDQTTTYTLTVTSANGACSSTGSVTVTITPADIDIPGDALREICLGQTVNLSADVSPAGGKVSWMPDFYVMPATGLNVATMPDESITVIARYEVNGCSVLDSVRIRVDSLPDLTIRRKEDKSIYCPGDTIYLLSNTYEPANFPGIRQTWDSFDGELTPVESWNMVILATTTHTFQRITVNHGCTDTSTVEVPVGVPPTVTVQVNPSAICPGQSAVITATVDPVQVVEWDDPSGTLSCKDCLMPFASPLNTTQYTISTPNADCPAGATALVTVLPLPALSLADRAICLGESTVLNNIPTNPADSYTWTADPAGPIDDIHSPSPSVTPAVTTTYTVMASGQCNNQDSVTITVNDGTIDAGPDQVVCAGTPVTLTATTGGTAGVVVWSPGGLSGNTITVTPGATTTYAAILSYQPNCVKTDSVTVVVHPVPQLNLGLSPDSLCLGDAVLLNSIDESPAVSYTWSSDPPGYGSMLATPLITPMASATYTVMAKTAFCENQGSKQVLVFDAAIDAGPGQVVCPETPVTLTATATGSPGSVTWVPLNITGNPVTFTPDMTDTYTAVLNYGKNCTATSDVTISVLPKGYLGALSATPAVDSLCAGAEITLRTDSVSAGLTLMWLENGAPITGAALDSLVVSPPGDAVPVTVQYTLVATTVAGCTTTRSFDQIVKPCFVFPNAFTPDNDDINDTFSGILTFGGKLDVTEFRVFNRWGDKVFEATPTRTAWDGKVNDKDAPTDVYVYYITIRFASGTQKTFHGEVTLIR